MRSAARRAVTGESWFCSSSAVVLAVILAFLALPPQPPPFVTIMRPVIVVGSRGEKMALMERGGERGVVAVELRRKGRGVFEVTVVSEVPNGH